MKLDEITSIHQSHDLERVNELLSRGWKLVKILSSKSQDADRETVKPIYILGLSKEKPKEE